MRGPAGKRLRLAYSRRTDKQNNGRDAIMRRSLCVFGLLLLAGASTPVLAQRGGGAEAQAARAAQAALEARTPKLAVTEEILPLRIPGHTLGETEGVSRNKAGHLFVYTRTGWSGSSRGGNAAKLFEFDQNNKYVKEWLPDSYGASFAHAVRVDPQQNVWVVDEGSNTVVKVDPTGLVKMVLGRKPESIDWWEEFTERGGKDTDLHPVGTMGTFNRPTDVAWGPDGSIFVSDGYNNSRVVKISKDGVWEKSYGTYGSGDGQMRTPHGIAAGYGHVYVADRGNNRIQVFDYNLNFQKYITGMGAPWSVQVTPKYIYSGDGNGKIYRFDHDGKLLGWAQTSLGQGQTGCLIHSLQAEGDNVLYKGACSLWNVEKITFRD
jgi:DNA-binding beta-propeller fold protein YncE